MSVINQMLQDLERRRAPLPERRGIAGYVRALPEGGESTAPRWLIGLAALGVVGTLCAFAYTRLAGGVPRDHAVPVAVAEPVRAVPAPAQAADPEPGSMSAFRLSTELSRLPVLADVLRAEPAVSRVAGSNKIGRAHV